MVKFDHNLDVFFSVTVGVRANFNLTIKQFYQ